jgi:hypothetical protein
VSNVTTELLKLPDSIVKTMAKGATNMTQEFSTLKMYVQRFREVFEKQTKAEADYMNEQVCVF